MDCTPVTKKNLGKSKTNCLPNLIKCMITTPSDFVLAANDYASFDALKDALQDLIKNPINSRGYLWPRFSKVEDISTEAQYEDSVLSFGAVHDGQYRHKFYVSKNLCTHKAMFTHRATDDGRVLFIDVDNQIIGTEDEDGNIMGFSIQTLHTEKMKFSDGTNKTTSPILVVLSDNEELDLNGVLIGSSIASCVNTLERLTDVALAAHGAFAAAGFVVDVSVECDGTPISGLVLADFLMYNADKTATQPINAVTEDANIPGRYTIAAPGGNLFEDGVLTLKAPSLLTIDAYEVPVVNELTVDVP